MIRMPHFYYKAGWNQITTNLGQVAWAYFPADSSDQYAYVMRINEERGLVYVYAGPDEHHSIGDMKLPAVPMTTEEKMAWALATYRMKY